MTIRTRILGTGAYLPAQKVSSAELEKKLGFPEKTFEKTSGVETRYHAAGETSSDMGARAARDAIGAAGVPLDAIDAIVAVSGVPQQAIPSTAALIHQKLRMKRTLAFDINATCLSFLTGLVCMGNMIAQGIYRHVVLVASDIATVGLDPKNPKIASLFGDGAAAVVLGPAQNGEGITAFHFETNSESIKDCYCEAGGTLLALQKVPDHRLYFKMNGPRLFKTAIPPLVKMYYALREKAGGFFDMVIPHQASPFALDLIQKKLKLPPHQFMHIVREYGNMIAASLPFALHKAIIEKKIERNDKVFFMGTGAGLTIGGVVLEY